MFNQAFQPARTEFDWLSRDEAVVDAYVHDPWCGFGLDSASGKSMFIEARKFADPAQLAAIRSELPIHIVVGESDPVNAEMQLVYALVDRLHSAGLGNVTLQSYPEGRHEILNETNRDEVVDEIVTWVKDTVGS
jgi:alpha-beta hydrolase superfamily lysophospholipase